MCETILVNAISACTYQERTFLAQDMIDDHECEKGGGAIAMFRTANPPIYDIGLPRLPNQGASEIDGEG